MNTVTVFEFGSFCCLPQKWAELQRQFRGRGRTCSTLPRGSDCPDRKNRGQTVNPLLISVSSDLRVISQTKSGSRCGNYVWVWTSIFLFLATARLITCSQLKWVQSLLFTQTQKPPFCSTRTATTKWWHLETTDTCLTCSGCPFCQTPLPSHMYFKQEGGRKTVWKKCFLKNIYIHTHIHPFHFHEKGPESLCKSEHL